MLPAGAERAAKVAFRLGPATATPRQLGPISRAPCERTSASSCSCRSSPSLPIFGEAGRDHDERADALAQRLLGRAENRRARKRDHGQVDRVGDLLDRLVAANAGDRLAVAVHGVGGAREVPGEDVAEELAADRAASLGGADDGDAPRLEEGSERRDDRLVVAGLDVLAVRLGRRDRELHLELAALELARQLEPGRLEHAQHGAVIRQHVGDEALDPDLGGSRRQLLEQPRPDPAALVLVGDGEGRLGELRVAQPDVVGDGDDALSLVVDQCAQQRSTFPPVRLEHRLAEARSRSAASRGSAGRGFAATGRRRRPAAPPRRRGRVGAAAACGRRGG